MFCCSCFDSVVEKRIVDGNGGDDKQEELPMAAPQVERLSLGIYIYIYIIFNF